MPGTETRPTPDRLREALFNILSPRIEGAVFLDAYAGTGAVGIEALSRGAAKAILIESAANALQVLRDNVRMLGLDGEAMVVRGNVAAVLHKHPCDIAFVDPPYTEPGEYERSLLALSQTNCSLAIAQHASRYALNAEYGLFHRVRLLRQGDNSLSFYERVPDV